MGEDILNGWCGAGALAREHRVLLHQGLPGIPQRGRGRPRHTTFRLCLQFSERHRHGGNCCGFGAEDCAPERR